MQRCFSVPSASGGIPGKMRSGNMKKRDQKWGRCFLAGQSLTEGMEFIPHAWGDVNTRISRRSNRGFFKSAENGVHARLIPWPLGFEPLHYVRVDSER
jgi:hypothetical protein